MLCNKLTRLLVAPATPKSVLQKFLASNGFKCVKIIESTTTPSGVATRLVNEVYSDPITNVRSLNSMCAVDGLFCKLNHLMWCNRANNWFLW
jgi:hypothetical protein